MIRCAGSGNSSQYRDTRILLLDIFHMYSIFQQQNMSGIDKYQFIKRIGKGSFATVKLAVADDGSRVAIKIIRKSKVRDDITIKREAAILRSVNHTNIIKYYDLLQDKSKYYIIMELIDGDELYNVTLKYPGGHGIPESQSKKYFSQIVSAVSYCHSQFISHRDLKLENIMLGSDDNVKLIDFGLSTRLHSDGTKNNTWCGSPMYAAPEICNHNEYTLPQVDIWCLGIILYAMLSSKLPFGGRDDREVSANVSRCIYKIPIYIPLLAADLITRILKRDPVERPSLLQIREHVWLAEYAPIDLQLPQLPQTLSINLLIIEKMEGLGFNGDRTMQSLRRGENNEYTTVYNDLTYRIYQKKQNSKEHIRSIEIPYITRDRRGRSEPDLRSSQDIPIQPNTVHISPTLARNSTIRKNSSGQKFLQKLMDL
jgi:serine/threonine protein kinase